MSFLEKNTTRKIRVDENAIKLDSSNKGKKYKKEEIYKSAVYAKESVDHILGLYYLLF